jgi:hypothetical protein
MREKYNLVLSTWFESKKNLRYKKTEINVELHN